MARAPRVPLRPRRAHGARPGRRGAPLRPPDRPGRARSPGGGRARRAARAGAVGRRRPAAANPPRHPRRPGAPDRRGGAPGRGGGRRGARLERGAGRVRGRPVGCRGGERGHRSGGRRKLTAMRLFIDTGSVAEVEEVAAWGVLAGATTNPSLLAKEEGDPGDIIRRICDLVQGPVSAEVVSDDAIAMVEEGHALNALHEHVIVKVPFSSEGLRATRALSSEGIAVNMTLVFSANQALLSAQAGATYVSCFMGRLDDISVDSAAVVAEIVEALRPGGTTAQVLAASIRHPEHVVTAARLGCEIATVPAKVLRQMLDHPLTESGRERFKSDWQSRPEFGEWLRELVSKQSAST